MRYGHAGWLVAAVATIGCGGDDTVDLTGVYEVEVHVVSADTCDDPVAVEDGLPYVKFSEEDIFGVPFYQWNYCQDAGGAECEEQSGFTLYGEPIEGGWESRITFAFPSSTECGMGMTRSTAVLEGDALRIDTRQFVDTVAVGPEDCTLELVEERAEQMPCVNLEQIDAVRL